MILSYSYIILREFDSFCVLIQINTIHIVATQFHVQKLQMRIAYNKKCNYSIIKWRPGREIVSATNQKT